MNIHALFIGMADLRSKMSDASFSKCVCVLHPVLAPYLSRDGMQYQMNTELVL